MSIESNSYRDCGKHKDCLIFLLLTPYTYKSLTTSTLPQVKGDNCRHRACFDLETYVALKIDKCPVCSRRIGWTVSDEKTQVGGISP